MTITTINPATGKIIQQYPVMSDSQINASLEQAHTAYDTWRMMALSERCDLLATLTKLLEANERALAELITQEMGKPIEQSLAEVQKCQRLCQYMIEHVAELLQPQVVQTEHQSSEVHYVPMGIIFAIMPWNFPLWQVLRFAVGNLMAGNVVMLKHAPNVTGVALRVAELFIEAGFPSHVFTTVVIEIEQAASIIQDKRVRGVTLTGSGAAGKVVAAQAGAALKKVMLELGGSDPYLILEDADLSHAADVCVAARMANAGQVCIAPKRCIVVDSVYETLQQHIMQRIQQYTCADPMLPTTKLGPLAREDLREHLQQQVQQSIAMGAKLLCGGTPMEGPGFFYPATVLTDVKPGMPAFAEELFGPVVSLVSAKDEDEAIALANNTDYGLGAAIFTQDIARGQRIALQSIDTGTCYVNAAVASDPRLPIGGVKASGFGRELAEAGLKEFLNTKVVCIA